jgi:hypothetical protein
LDHFVQIDQPQDLGVDPCLLGDLAPRRIRSPFARLHVTARQAPHSGQRSLAALTEED